MASRFPHVLPHSRRLVRDIISQFSAPSGEDLDSTLDTLRNRLGLNPEHTDADLRQLHAQAAVYVHNTKDLSRNIYYAPDMDGQAEPGEVVWMWLRTEPHAEPEDRALVVVGRTRQTILGLLISSNPEHEHESEWIDIGSGNWDLSGAPSWARIDRVVEVFELGIRRQGAIVPRRRFEKIAHRLRADFGWG